MQTQRDPDQDDRNYKIRPRLIDAEQSFFFLLMSTKLAIPVTAEPQCFIRLLFFSTVNLISFNLQVNLSSNHRKVEQLLVRKIQ